MAGAEPIQQSTPYLASPRKRSANPRHTEPEPLDPILYSLKAQRLELGISQATLAVQLAVSQQAICEWERGYYSPTLRTMRRWADALDMTLTATHLPFLARDTAP